MNDLYGIYNAGYIYFKNDNEGINFLKIIETFVKII